MSLREPAWRVTCRELASSVEEERGTSDRAASYVLSPFGARMNRVVLAGTISAAEAIGREEPTSFWRARLADPLGTVAITAGSFQPRAMVQLRAAPAGRPALVIGKVHLFRGRDGTVTASVRAEVVRPVDESTERGTLAEAVRQTLDRLDLIERLEHEPAVPDATLRAEGYPAIWVRGARDALRRYPDAARADYRAALRGAVAHVAGRSLAPGGPSPDVRITVDPVPVPPRPPTPEERADEAAFLDRVDAAAESSADGYADVRDVVRELVDRGLDAGRVEAALGRLEEGGVLEEPIVGKLRRA